MLNEDTALILKRRHDQGEPLSNDDIKDLLNSSHLIEALLTPPIRPPKTFVGIRAYEWRLLELIEIPFVQTLELVNSWVELLVSKTYMNEGFALEGTIDHMLACHNSMITRILLSVDYEDKKKIDAGIDWIQNYQAVSRNFKCEWPGKDLYTRWGGCMKSIPCYHGIVKAMKTLTLYKQKYGLNKSLESKLKDGLEYILQHRVYKKLSQDNPIEDGIILNFYPYPYRSNLVEILDLLKANNLLDDQRCEDAIELLKNKRRKDGYWQVDKTYMKSAWIEFDIPRKPGLWITYIIKQLLDL